MKILVGPIVKNRTGYTFFIGNYRPMSLPTIVGKVLDSLLDKH